MIHNTTLSTTKIYNRFKVLLSNICSQFQAIILENPILPMKVYKRRVKEQQLGNEEEKVSDKQTKAVTKPFAETAQE